MKYYQENTNQITLHWKNVGEENLFLSEFIHNFNRQRKLRLLKLKEGTSKVISEFGLDGFFPKKCILQKKN